METLFLKILNMSITGSYVILAVLLLRLLLKRAPKKYSYFLWSVVLFRLVCPVSFSSVFSIFQAKPFDMTTAQSGGGAALRYVPVNIGQMQTPKITVGIPMMNSMISGSLPSATPYASANPLQIFVAIGAILWLSGIAIFLIYSAVAYRRLIRRAATAVRLEGSVFESDRIRSPFLLGFFRPRILIPFGLAEQERAYILRHERVHLKRGDHLIKLLGFCVLVVHWFNPLVWLAFALMAKDMEMSCDEAVLSKEGPGITRDYSTSLLSFAANRRVPAWGPLAFGETGIRERVKNILRFRTPKRAATVFVMVLCVAAVAACAANPMKSLRTPKLSELYGSYAFEKQIYMNPLSSFMAMDGMEEYYTLTDSSFQVTDAAGNSRIYTGKWEEEAVDEKAFLKSFFMEGFGIPELSSYREKRQYTLTTADGVLAYRLYSLDGDFWLAQLHVNGMKKSPYIWSIYKIKAYDGKPPMKLVLSGYQLGVDAFLKLNSNFKSSYEDDKCFNVTANAVYDNTEYRVFKYDKSCASFLQYDGAVYPMGEWFGGSGVTSMAAADLNGDGKMELFFTYSWGSGLHRSQAATFDPVEKKMVNLDFVQMNDDMIVAQNETGGLSLYRAKLASSKGFAEMTFERGEKLADVVCENGKIQSKPVK